MKRNSPLLLLLLLALVFLPFSVRAVSTSSYQVTEEQTFWSSNQTISTSSYAIDSAIEPMTGSNSTSSYSVESGSAFRYLCGDGFIDPGESCEGSDLNGATCVTQGFASGTLSCSSSCAYVTTSCASAGGGGGGGGGGSVSSGDPDEPEVDETLSETVEDEDFITYSDTYVIYGEMDSDVEEILVNDSSDGVTLTSDTTWSATVELEEGDNTFTIVAVDDDGDESDETEISIYRHAYGDINDDDDVNDYDLSLLVMLWGTDDDRGDFNDDDLVDDYDFSIFVSRWG